MDPETEASRRPSVTQAYADWLQEAIDLAADEHEMGNNVSNVFQAISNSWPILRPSHVAEILENRTAVEILGTHQTEDQGLPFRKFTPQDWGAWAGAMPFTGGADPYCADSSQFEGLPPSPEHTKFLIIDAMDRGVPSLEKVFITVHVPGPDWGIWLQWLRGFWSSDHALIRNQAEKVFFPGFGAAELGFLGFHPEVV